MKIIFAKILQDQLSSELGIEASIDTCEAIIDKMFEQGATIAAVGNESLSAPLNLTIEPRRDN